MKKLSKCIGIISYLPEDKQVKEARFNKLLKLIKHCDYLFKLPIILIAQNYSSNDLNKILEVSNDTKIYTYQKLGITGARRELRKKFLESDYDYLIMLDDDCGLSGLSSTEYLKQIDSNPDCFIEFKATLLKLFAISRTIFKEVDYDNIEAERGEGFEDRLFVNTLRLKFPDARRQFINTGIFEASISTKDPLSTWYTNQNLTQMINNTNIKIADINEKKD